MIVWFWESLAFAAGPFASQSPPGAAFRAVAAAIVGCLLVLISGPAFIAWFGKRFAERVASPSAEIQRLHAHKTATPTLGGLFILAALVGSMALLVDWRLTSVWLAGFTLVGFAAIGLVDDLRKLSSARRGLSARSKFAAQLAVGLVAAIALQATRASEANDAAPSLQPLFVACGLVVTLLVLVGSSNAVNLTDGLDGLAAGCLAWAFAALSVVALWRGASGGCDFLGRSPASGSQEMAVIAAAACGAVVGFLRFNRHPAAVFMGDTGALPLGALLGLVATVARAELLLAPIGGVFVVETSSVILQVASFRWTGRRVFRCAPLHHHFQLGGWTEGKIVSRFWIAAAICGSAGLLAAALEFPGGERDTAAPRPSPLAVSRRDG